MSNRKLLTKIIPVLALILVAAVVISGCSSSGESQESDSPGLIRGEHEREGDEGSGEHSEESGGEESGTEFALDETYDMVRNGARLILVYDSQSNSFIGTVENSTNNTLKQVRVEVHLSNGTELGPTIPADLEPGEVMKVKLPATSEAFDGWSAHPEVGGGEGGGEHSDEGGEHGGEGSSEHSGEGNGEHDGEGSGG